VLETHVGGTGGGMRGWLTVVEDVWLQARHGAHEAHYGQGEHETHDGQGGEGGTVRMREVGPERRAERLGRDRP